MQHDGTTATTKEQLPSDVCHLSKSVCILVLMMSRITASSTRAIFYLQSMILQCCLRFCTFHCHVLASHDFALHHLRFCITPSTILHCTVYDFALHRLQFCIAPSTILHHAVYDFALHRLRFCIAPTPILHCTDSDFALHRLRFCITPSTILHCTVYDFASPHLRFCITPSTIWHCTVYDLALHRLRLSFEPPCLRIAPSFTISHCALCCSVSFKQH
jgi:hypothetical protein